MARSDESHLAARPIGSPAPALFVDRSSGSRKAGRRQDSNRVPRAGPSRAGPVSERADLPADVDTRSLHRAVRAELRSLPKDLAEIVAGHLVLAGQLVDAEPELAYAHAEAARRRAARLPIVREAAAETAYAAGHYDVALSEFRALRRMTGTDDYLPVMADCERALGRPQNALKLAKESERRHLDPALRIEMTIVEAGARADLGQHPEARRILDRAVRDRRTRVRSWPSRTPGCSTRTPTCCCGPVSRPRPGTGSPAPPGSTPSSRPTPSNGWMSWTVS